MAFTDPSPYMSLPVPEVGIEIGPQWAIDLNACLAIIDQHNHLPGLGVPIVSAALNINASVPFNDNDITGLRTARFQSQVSLIPATGLDLGCLYESGVDLYYNDGSGNQIRLTQSGGVAGTPGSIGGLVPPASATYIPLTETFVFQSAANTPANLDGAAFTLRNLVANSRGLTLFPPNAMGADYTITLPALPAQQSFVTLDQLGNMLAPWTVDGSTIKIVSNQLVASASALADGITIDTTGGGLLEVRHGDREHNWELNGTYPSLTFPATGIDAIFLAPYNVTITSVWFYSGTAGASGTTELDLKVASPGASYTSILSTTGKVTSAAASNIWTDSGAVVSAQTGITKPVLATTAITAGQAIRFDLIQSMASPAQDIRIRIYYKQS